jgi:hypothetical protein
MRKYPILFAAVMTSVVTASLLMPTISFAQAKEGAKYIGVKQCKMCHTGETKGNIFESWSATKHAKATENLPADKKADAACLACHSTGHGKAMAAGKTAEEFMGVQCEACHGPGSEYKLPHSKKDAAAAVAAGMVPKPDEKLCTGCHKAELPAGIEAHAKAGKFVFAEAYKKIEHHMKKVEAK